NQLANELLSYECIPITALIGSDKKTQKTMDQVPSADVAIYASEDADIALRLANVLEGDLEALSLSKLANELEMPLVEVLANMEQVGIKIDLPYLESLREEFAKKIDELTAACYAAAEREFTIGSPKQLAEVLFDELGLQPTAKTSTGKRSTSVEVLEELRSQHALPGLVLDYRKYTKLASTYVDALPKLADAEGRVHTTFRQAVSTGRLASVDPNVQNIPVRTEEGKLLRKAFIATDDKHRLIVADYSQIELRILAHLSGDERMCAAFKDGRDIHRAVAAEVNNCSEAEVDSEMRSKVKAIHFGILYGQSAHGLSQALGISRGEAKGFIDAYFDRFPKVQAFIAKTHDDVQRDGYVVTMLGRRRVISGAQDRNRMRQAAALRQAFNTVVQGTAADLIKTAMLRVHRKIRDDGLPYKLLIQVHDELMLEAPAKEAKAACSFLENEMRAALELDVPLVVDAHAGVNWLEAKE
ncbi:MAG: DNA polymerase I, partial [Planctomycetes bacterium]|nr:DNA polymerase I [Planctomycetota bacterium]